MAGPSRRIVRRVRWGSASWIAATCLVTAFGALVREGIQLGTGVLVEAPEVPRLRIDLQGAVNAARTEPSPRAGDFSPLTLLKQPFRRDPAHASHQEISPATGDSADVSEPASGFRLIALVDVGEAAGGMAIVVAPGLDARLITIGDEIQGFRLTSVRGGAAELTDGKRVVSLMLPALWPPVTD
jgi:hypothetical protein